MDVGEIDKFTNILRGLQDAGAYEVTVDADFTDCFVFRVKYLK